MKSSSVERRPGRPDRQRLVLPAILLTIALAPAGVQASGITLGRFGGIFGHPNADGGLALYWNPARTAVEPGGWANLDGTFVYRIAAYDRTVDDPTASEAELAVNTGEATLTNAAVLPYLAGGYTLELEPLNLAIGVGAFPAYGGTAEWDKHPNAPTEFPGALDGPQRWSTITAGLAILHYTGAAAVTLPDLGLSLGFTVGYVDAELDTVRARNLNRTDDPVDSDGELLEGRVHFNGHDDAIAFTAGVSYEIDNVRMSGTYRSGYDLTLVGPARQAYATNDPTTVEAFLELPLPHVFQSAVSVVLGQLHLTAFTDFTAWSVIKENDVLVEETRERLLLIPRDLENTFSARVLVGWQFSEVFQLTGMVGFDPSAIPAETTDSSLFDAEKLQLGLGALLDFDWLRVRTSYAHDIYFPAEIEGSRHEPPQNGTFNDTRGFLNLSLEAHF